MFCRTWRAVLVLAVAVAAAGCGPGRPAVAPVDGVVTMKGKPLPGLRIQFMPDPNKGTKGPTSAGVTDEQGRFKLKCADKRDGAVVGWHKVVINDMRVRLPNAPRHGGAPLDEKGRIGNADDVVQKPAAFLSSRVPDPFTTSGRTPLSKEVKAEKQQEIAIELSQ
jgi:hypothetical protein